MKPFLDDNFLLQTKTAETLYHGYAKQMPILDYHNHLPPSEIAQNRVFENTTQIWLNGDHYKWRAMRANGVDERFITGDAPDYEKFAKWAETVPYTLRNPLYHWTHLELKNPFGITTLLKPETARDIYDETSELLRNQFSVRQILTHFNVKTVCTTDDPVDSLEHHKAASFPALYPTFRPDRAMAVENVGAYNTYLDRLSEVADVDVASWEKFLEAMRRRHDFFASRGCRLSDHGLETMYASAYTENEIHHIFLKIRARQSIGHEDVLKYKSACLYEFAKLDHEKGWTQQFHLGALRNNNSRLLQTIGADAGVDSIGAFSAAQAMSRFFDRLDKENKLAKTIIYNLNPADNEVFATMIGNFQGGPVAGKMQFGSGWWFLDQKDGMEKQLNALSNMGLLSRFVGMLTDSRSFLSFSRHEYFRRILCNLLGNDVENGELPNDEKWMGQTVQDICYNNAERFFGFNSPQPAPTPSERGG